MMSKTPVTGFTYKGTHAVVLVLVLFENMLLFIISLHVLSEYYQFFVRDFLKIAKIYSQQEKSICSNRKN